MLGAAREKPRLPRFSVVLATETFNEVDGLRCLGLLDGTSHVRRLMC